jgi:hypothetical protein
MAIAHLTFGSGELKNGIPYLQCTECISAASKGIKIKNCRFLVITQKPLIISKI